MCPVCPVNSQILLTGDRSVLDRNTGITSSEENPRNPASEFTVSTLGWCSPDQTANISSLYVEVTFMEPIIPVILISGGKQNAYVQNFTLLYTTDEASNDFEAYGVLKSAQVQQVFSILLVCCEGLVFIAAWKMTATRESSCMLITLVATFIFVLESIWSMHFL